MCKMSPLNGDICICSAVFYVYAENGLLPLILIILSFVLLYVRGMVRVIVVTLLAHHTQHIRFVITIREQESSLNMLTIAPDFPKGFSCSFSRFLLCWVVAFLIWIVGRVAVNCTAELTKITQGRKSLRAETKA